MKIRSAVGAVLLAGCAVFTSAQTQTDVVQPVVITGEVVRYEPGHVIVIRSADKGEVSYTLTPSLTVPTGIEVGRTVSLYTEPGEGGATLVKRVTTTSVTPSGNVKRTTEETRTTVGVRNWKSWPARTLTSSVSPPTICGSQRSSSSA